ncbi:MAG: RagB/SusD family nutrient uptake outer membrane protein [Dysgonamonadaceae bacterium]|jgi:hypothetical protein|nr:RagB/SusD family nutrient uptake outer membrane protein [Dysgonamonadaceae bacterium]
MKKIIGFLAIIILMSGCGESFLDTENLTKKDSQSFPKKPGDAEQVLTSVYRQLIEPDDPKGSVFMLSEIMSDERFGAGGLDDRFIRALATFRKIGENDYGTLWSNYYSGIYRVNFLISSLDNVNWDSEEQRNRIEGEAYFMRAYFYFDLARIYGTVPLVTEPTPQNNPKASAEELFAQIGTDLKIAIEKLPTTPYTVAWGNANLGHATKWAAEGIMARAFLFYTGYYKQTTMGDITKEQVIGWVDDCVGHSGHTLLPDFRSLWPYSYSQEYPYAKDNSLHYVGEDGANTEAVFVHRHFGWNYLGRNLEVLFFGFRYQDNYADCFPFGQGWGGGTVNPNTFAAWNVNDIRRKGSILDVRDASEDVNYQVGKESQMEDTYLFAKKYIPINVKREDGSILAYIKDMRPEYAFPGLDYQSENMQDYISLRFADILLMGAELGSSQAQNYLDRVRSRAGLPSVPVTLDNIKSERRWELAFEGLRYFDLLRWHDENKITENQTNVDVLNIGKEAKLNVRFRPETGGFLPILLNQIELSGGILVQNPGWEGADAIFSE